MFSLFRPYFVVNLLSLFVISALFYHSFYVTTDDASVHVEITPADRSVQFLVLVRFDKFPRLSGDDIGWDYLQTVPRTILQKGSCWNYL